MYTIHQTPGRLRLRTPALKDQPAKASAASVALRGIAGVKAVRASPTTGSVTISYDVHAVSPATLLAHLTEAGLLTGVVGLPLPLPRQGERAPHRATPEPAFELRIDGRKWLGVAARLLLPLVAEKAFGKPGKAVVSALF